MPWVDRKAVWSSYVSLTERLCAGLSYFTFGMSGLLYMLFAKRSDQSELFRFHVIQASLLWVLAWIIRMAAAPILSIVISTFAAIAPGPAAGAADLIGMVLQVVTIAFGILLAYGAVFAFLAKFAEVPFISHLVRANMSRWG